MTRTLLTCIVLSLLAGGCAAHWPNQETSLQGAQAQFDIPPKEMVQKVKQIVSDPPLSIGIQEESHGSILTGYQSFPGEFHITRRWQERTQFHIQIIPDFDAPTAKCMVQVRERTETRAADGMQWGPLTDSATRSERADDLLKTIQQKAGH